MENKYTLGKEPEAIILWSLMEDNTTKKRRKITSKLHNFNTELNELINSNLSDKTKKRLIINQWHNYRDNYVNAGYDKDNKIDTFYLCLLKIRYREATGYIYKRKNK